MPIIAKILGYLGLIPFLFYPLHMLLDLQWLTSMQAQIAFTQYSAVILSFFGGIHWYQAICEPKNSHQLYVAMLPSISARWDTDLSPGTVTVASPIFDGETLKCMKQMRQPIAFG